RCRPSGPPPVAGRRGHRAHQRGRVCRGGRTLRTRGAGAPRQRPGGGERLHRPRRALPLRCRPGPGTYLPGAPRRAGRKEVGRPLPAGRLHRGGRRGRPRPGRVPRGDHLARGGSAVSGSLVDRVLAGEVRAASRLMRRIDDEDPAATADLQALFPRTGRAYVLGVTGSPGAGKSTLTDRVVARFRAQGKSVGVLAVDPTSPFSGGAILGDRIRMQDHASDPGVFIRSLATRGSLGGLSRATGDCIRVMDAMGKDVIVVETVGVGQDEIDIAQMAHTTLLVTVPGMGDDIQAIKAGILEVADVFIVNKADLDGADRTVRELPQMLQLP